MLEHAIENQEQFAKLFGLATISSPSAIAANYPYIISQVAKKLRQSHWVKIDNIITRIKSEKSIDIKAFDNKYHIAIKYGKSVNHKYSEDAVILFRKALRNEPYEI